MTNWPWNRSETEQPDDVLDRALSAMRDEPAPDGPSGELVADTLAALDRVAVENERPIPLFRRVMTVRNLKISAGVLSAAAAAAVFGFCALWHGPEQAAYALEDLPKRLLEMKSIYMTGWMFEPDSMSEQEKGVPTKYPMKIFAERPDCYWQMGYSFSGPDSTHKDVRVRSGYAAGKGTRLLCVSTNDKTAMEIAVPAIQNELSTEMLIQSQLPQQWFSGRLHDFVKAGTETVNNVLCDVYEHSFNEPKSKKRLWLDPKTGFPVKIATYDIDQTGQEMLTLLFDHVEVNIPASATGLSFNPPKGFQVTKATQMQAANPLLQPVSSGSNGDVSLGIWHCFNIDDKAILLCWYCESRSGSKTGGATIQPELLAGTRPCNHINVASVDVGDHLWNWSLVWPKQTGERIGNDDFSVIHRTKKGGLLSVVSFPLRLREDRLKAILEEVQRTAKTDVPGSPKPFTLDMLRIRLAERR